MKEKLLISACLLGSNCKYNGGNNYHPLTEKLREKYTLVPVCPEAFGGLAVPHEPSERVGDRVLSRTGEDVTAAFRRGAEKTLRWGAALLGLGVLGLSFLQLISSTANPFIYYRF